MPETRQFNFANFARSVLASAIDADDTVLSVESADTFPTIDPTYDEIFSIVLRDSATQEIEIMYVTLVEDDQLTVERGAEGTTARAWDALTAVVHAPTAGFFEALADVPPLWTPSQMVTQAWFDAADTNTVSTVSGAVSQLNDKSGNGRHISQATSGKRPAYASVTLNSLNTITFNPAAANVLAGNTNLTGLLQNLGEATLIAVRRWTDLPATTEVLLNVANNADVTRADLVSGIAASRTGAGGRRLDSDSFDGIAVVGDMSIDWVIHAGVFDYTNAALSVYLDGVLEAEDTSFNTAGVTSDTAPTFLLIGSNVADTDEYFDGDFAEAIIYHGVDAATRQLLEGYLAWKWGLQANLPLGHPYKDAAPTVE